MFRYQLFADIKKKAKYDSLPQDNDPTPIGPINSPAITTFKESLNEPESYARAVKLGEDFKRVKASAEAGDKLCQEFLAFEYTFLDPHNKFQVNCRDMAERAFREHNSPIGAYVLFHCHYDENNFEEAAKYLTSAIESDNPDVRFALAMWLKPVDIPLSFPKGIKLIRLIGSCNAFSTFCENHFDRNNPFYTALSNPTPVLSLVPALTPPLKFVSIAGALGPDDGSIPPIQLTFLHHFFDKDYAKAWEAFKEIVAADNFVAESILVVLSNNNMFWFIDDENASGCGSNDENNNENTLADLVAFKATIPAFNAYIQNSLLVSTFINEEHLRKRVALKKYQNAIFAEDFKSAEEHLTVALDDYDLGIIFKFLHSCSFLERYIQQFPVGVNLLKALASETSEKAAFSHFWKSFREDSTRAAHYFSLATANSTPEITSMFIRDCIFSSVEHCDATNSLKSLIELQACSPEFHQFIMTYKGYWPHLEKAVLEKNKEFEKVAESEPDAEWWRSSLCLM